MTSVKNQAYRNRLSANQGRQFENLIELGCQHYRVKGLAEVEKTPEPFMVTKLLGKNNFTGKFVGNAQPDFQGTISGGRSVVFEAKYTSKDRINQKVITKTQWDYLDSHSSKGALAGVCVNIGRTYAFIPWPVWKEMKQTYGRMYLLEKEIEKYAVKTPGKILFLDYQSEVELPG